MWSSTYDFLGPIVTSIRAVAKFLDFGLVTSGSGTILQGGRCLVPFQISLLWYVIKLFHMALNSLSDGWPSAEVSGTGYKMPN